MTISDYTMLDTNVLVYAYFEESQYHEASFSLLKQAHEGTALLCVSPQVLAEFYAVITQPKRTTKPFAPSDAITEIKKLKALPGLMTLPVPLDVVEIWGELVQEHAVIGQKIYDVQLVATMLGHEITRLYTYNGKDFERFPVTPMRPGSPPV